MQKCLLTTAAIFLTTVVCRAVSYQDLKKENKPGRLSASDWHLHGRAESSEWMKDGTLQMAPPVEKESVAFSMAGASEDQVFQIDAWVDPVIDPSGDDDLIAGISFGMTNGTDPSPLVPAQQRISFQLRERATLDLRDGSDWRERHGRWMITIDGQRMSDRLFGSGDFYNPDSPSQLPYAFRLRGGAFKPLSGADG